MNYTYVHMYICMYICIHSTPWIIVGRTMTLFRLHRARRRTSRGRKEKKRKNPFAKSGKRNSDIPAQFFSPCFQFVVRPPCNPANRRAGIQQDVREIRYLFFLSVFFLPTGWPDCAKFQRLGKTLFRAHVFTYSWTHLLNPFSRHIFNC
jgi:hypothetical protein